METNRGGGRPRPTAGRVPILVLVVLQCGLVAADLWGTAFASGEEISSFTSLQGGEQRPLSDPEYFVELSREPVLSRELWARLPLYPLLIKLLGAGSALHALQVVASAAAWSWLAVEIARLVQRAWLGWVVGGCVLLMSRSEAVQVFNHASMSDSISLQLQITLVALALRSLRQSDRWSPWALAGIAVPWALVRPTNLFTLALAGALLVVVAWRRANLRPHVAPMGAWLLCVAIATSGLVTWGGEGPRVLYNIIPRWVLAEPEMRDYFEARGMPVPPQLEASIGTPLSLDPTLENPGLGEFRRWVEAEGTATYLSWLLTHPAWSLRTWTYSLDDVVAPDLSAEHDAIESVAVLTGRREPAMLGVADLFWIPSAAAMVLWSIGAVVGLVVAARRTEPPAWVLGGFALVASVPLLAVPAVFGDSEALDRHALGTAVQLRLGLLGVTLWLVSRALDVKAAR